MSHRTQNLATSSEPSEPEIADPAPKYVATDCGIVRLVPDKDGQLRDVPLANFDARIVRALNVDDGEENRKFFDIEIRMKNGNYKRNNLPAEEFDSLNWVIPDTCGHGSIEPPRTNRELLRHAIQTLSGDFPTENHFGHLGWRQVGGKWVYLHAGGAIGADGAVPGLTVDLGAALPGFNLPNPADRRDELRDAVRASMRMVHLAPRRISGPLFATIWRAPIAESDFCVFLVGPTGAGKTVLASLAQQHWGKALDYAHAPASWLSTANANEGLRFVAKDSLLLIDDLAPDTASRAAIDRTIRGQGNAAGRARMRPDSSLRRTKPPRCTLISTGEDTPFNSSATARTLVLRIARDDLNWEAVGACQRDADTDVFSLALAGYIQWLAPRLDDFRRKRPSQIQEIRSWFADVNNHARTAGILAELMYGLILWKTYAQEVACLSDVELNVHFDMVMEGMFEALNAQSSVQRYTDPVRQFGDLLRAALTGGHAHVASDSGRQPSRQAMSWGWHDLKSSGVRVGWVSENDLYLQAENTYNVIKKLATENGISLPGSLTLWQTLRERHVLITTDTAGRTLKIRRTIEGTQKRVLHLSTSLITDDPDAEPE